MNVPVFVAMLEVFRSAREANIAPAVITDNSNTPTNQVNLLLNHGAALFLLSLSSVSYIALLCLYRLHRIAKFKLHMYGI